MLPVSQSASVDCGVDRLDQFMGRWPVGKRIVQLRLREKVNFHRSSICGGGVVHFSHRWIVPIAITYIVHCIKTKLQL